MTEVQAVEERLAALEQKIDSFAAEHSEFRSVHVSRRGAEGGRGETGSVGPVGPPADPNQVAEIAAELVKKYFKHEDQVVKFERLLKDLEGQIDSSLITVKAALRWAVIEELKTSGAIDAVENTVPGPKGDTGATVVGPKGDPGVDGKSVVGPAGCDGHDAKVVIGNVVAGETASASLREEDGVQVLDLVLPRGEKGETGPASNVPGPKGDSVEGPQGIPGPGLSREDVVDLILNMKARGTLK